MASGAPAARDRKRHGRHYTPPELARFLAGRLLTHVPRPRSGVLRVLDPACGDGELLFALRDEAAIRLPGVRVELTGYDLDAAALAVARARTAGDGVDWHVGDFLAASEELAAGSFDAVITNPPYVRTQQLGGTTAQLLSKQFGLRGRIDLTHPFVATLPRLLCPDGVLGLLCANRFLTTKAGANIRRLLLAELAPVELYDLGDTKLFEAAVLPAITIATRAGSGAECRYVSAYEVECGEIPSKTDLFGALLDNRGCLVAHNGRTFAVEVGTLVTGHTTRSGREASGAQEVSALDGAAAPDAASIDLRAEGARQSDGPGANILVDSASQSDGRSVGFGAEGALPGQPGVDLRAERERQSAAGMNLGAEGSRQSGGPGVGWQGGGPLHPDGPSANRRDAEPRHPGQLGVNLGAESARQSDGSGVDLVSAEALRSDEPRGHPQSAGTLRPDRSDAGLGAEDARQRGGSGVDLWAEGSLRPDGLGVDRGNTGPRQPDRSGVNLEAEGARQSEGAGVDPRNGGLLRPDAPSGSPQAGGLLRLDRPGVDSGAEGSWTPGSTLARQLLPDPPSSRPGRRKTLRRIVEPETAWRMSNAEIDAWLAGIATTTWRTFGDVARIRVGIKTTADKVFISDRWADVEPPPEPELLRELITHHDLEPWRIARSHDTRVLYPYDLNRPSRTPIDLNEFPCAAEYLRAHKDTLAARHYLGPSGREWFEIWVPQRPHLWREPKLVFPDISERPRFALDRSGAVVNGDCYWISLPDLGAHPADADRLAYLLMGVANSALGLRFYDAVCGNRLYSGRRRWITQYVSRLPLPNPASPCAASVIDLARALVDGQVPDAAARADLDERVAAAFGVTPL
ncbi:Eco57I restriction-modification methylase domain-containing protein [Nocardia sp. NPDC051052]|uniref:Eco57I restriction-modification methylase domain-containing protein n=1 Tax=Nocardia sp. NPDC051052 TaxID=3364322 RepID=UPI003789E0FD